MTGVVIHKRDGSSEEFDRFKLFNSLVGATVKPQQAEEVTAEIESWLLHSPLPTMTVGKIKEKVIELLTPLNPQAAALYEEFDRPK